MPEEYGLHLGFIIITGERQMTTDKDDTKRFTDNLDKENLFGAIARGWCHEENAAKEMDADLAFAIAFEVSDIVIAKDATIARLTAALEEAEAQLAEANAHADRLANSLQKIASYNKDVLAGKINYRPEDHIAVADAALAAHEARKGGV